jgi:hypothetical protein
VIRLARKMIILNLLVSLSTMILCVTVEGKTPLSKSNIEATGISCFQNGQLIYMMKLNVSEMKAAKYIIEREQMGEKTRLPILESTYEDLARNQFTYVDVSGLVKHSRYRYYFRMNDKNGKLIEEVSTIALVKNIQFQDEARKYFPAYAQNNLTFTLGPAVDPENEVLEYRLYTRIPGGGGDKLVNSWRPKTAGEKVTVNFSESCEWKLVCIEVDANIPDRFESVLVDWSMFQAK